MIGCLAGTFENGVACFVVFIAVVVLKPFAAFGVKRENPRMTRWPADMNNLSDSPSKNALASLNSPVHAFICRMAYTHSERRITGL